MRRLIVGSGLAVLSMSFAAFGQMRAVATAHDLSISGATPRGKVAVCRVANTRIDGVESILRQERVVDVDADGVVVIPADAAAFRALWLAVDLSSGAWVVAAPAGYTPMRRAPPA